MWAANHPCILQPKTAQPNSCNKPFPVRIFPHGKACSSLDLLHYNKLNAWSYLTHSIVFTIFFSPSNICSSKQWNEWSRRDDHCQYSVQASRVLPCSAYTFSSVQFSHSVVSDSLWPHESQHARPPCPSPIPGVYPNSCPSSRWCHPAISSSVVPFSSSPQSLPASGSFPMSQLFASGGQNIGFSFNISPSNEHPGLISFRMDWLDLLAVQGTLKSLLQHHSSKASIIRHSAFFIVQLSHPYILNRYLI